MRFLYWIANHNTAGQRSLEDPMGIMGHMLRALGHEVVWDPSNSKLLPQSEGLNILVEGFTSAAVPVIADYYAQGARFLCIATEEPSARGFNHGRDPSMVLRQDTFPEVAKYFEGIFHLVPGEHVGDWFRRFAPTSYVELGYSPSLVRGADTVAPIYDFGFFGSLTHRRMTILKRLAKKTSNPKAVRIEATFTTQTERDKIMREAKVLLQIRKFSELGLVSSTRCNTALCLGRPVVGEPHELAEPWNKIVTFSKACKTCEEGGNNGRNRNFLCDVCVDNFIDLALLTKSMWKPVHARQFNTFRTMLTPDYCIGRAFREIGMDISGKTFRKVDPIAA